MYGRHLINCWKTNNARSAQRFALCVPHWRTRLASLYQYLVRSAVRRAKCSISLHFPRYERCPEPLHHSIEMSPDALGRISAATIVTCAQHAYVGHSCVFFFVGCVGFAVQTSAGFFPCCTSRNRSTRRWQTLRQSHARGHNGQTSAKCVLLICEIMIIVQIGLTFYISVYRKLCTNILMEGCIANHMR